MTRIGTTIFLGAGFSKWACDLPLVSQLFDFQITADTAKEARRVAILKSRYDAWRLKSKSDNAERFIEDMQADASDLALTNWYITRRLTEPFIRRTSRRFTWYVNSYHAQSDPGIAGAREFLRYAASLPNSPVITTNYDMIVEYALSAKGFNYGLQDECIGFSPYPYPRPVYASGRLPLLKLHGSLSWDAESKYPDSRSGLKGTCVIVPPRANKRPREHFPEVWEMAAEKLSSTRRMVFFGFAFNDYDEDVWNLLEANLCDAESILLIDVFDHRPRIASRFPNLRLEFMDASKGVKMSEVFNFVF